jgi:RND family efflux transporter MFP subunit
LFAKVSGYLGVQHVDIGARVKQGDLLAEIDVPELVREVEAAVATCHRAQARVKQAEASVATAIADQHAAESRIAQAKAEVEKCQSGTDLCKKQLDRITDLSGKKGIEARVVDEKVCELQTAQASQRAAESSVAASQQQAIAAESRVVLAKSDLEVAKADEEIAEAQLQRAKVMASYMKITSPYDGVVTCRNFHRGEYIRSPDQGGQIPLLEVDRTDKMRVVVRVPERDVPFVQAGDKASVRFDALPQRVFTAPVARVAMTEDPATRSMLAEIDLPNTEGIVCDHMYGRVEIALEEAPQGVTVPSACLAGDVANGQSKVFVVENGQAKERPVQVGRDTGAEVEVLSGLTPSDAVVLRPPGGLTSGVPVMTGSAPITPPAKK